MQFAWRNWLYIGAGVGVVAGLAYAFIPPPIEVEIERVRRGRLEVTINEHGKTRIRERYVVVAPLSGDLLRVEIHAGDPVTAAETVLAVLHPNDPTLLDARERSEAEAKVRAAEARKEHAGAMLERARASNVFATNQFDRISKLAASKVVSQEDLEQAEQQRRTSIQDVRAGELSVKIAIHEVELARAALERTKSSDNGQKIELRSPIHGQVLKVFRESEGTIASGAPIMEIGDRKDMEIEIDVLSSDAERIAPGAKVYLQRPGLPTLIARVRLVEPQAFLKVSALGVEEQRVNVLAEFSEPPPTDSAIGDAYRVEARIVISEANEVLKANAGAVFRMEEGWGVFRFMEGRATATKVEIGKSDGYETEIRSGLSENDEVIAYPSDKVRNNVRVTRRNSVR